MAYLYRHIRLDKNEPFYIGIGEDNNKNSKTYRRAKSKSNRNKYWLNIVNKTQYKIDILLDDMNWDEACEKEKEFIKLYGRKDLGKGTLVNMTDGGEGLKNPSQNILNNKSRLMKIYFKNNPTAAMDMINKRNKTLIENPEIMINLTNKRLKTFTQNPEIQENRVKNMDWIEIGKKLSLNYQNPDFVKKLSKSLSKPIIQLDLNNNIINTFSSLKEASNLLNIDNAGICNCLKGRSKKSGGFKWIYQ